jgi:proteasome accessory factor B
VSTRKAERLLNLIVCLLETDRPVTVQQIHDTVPGYAGQGFETFKRMFERDKDALREVGIPLDRAPVIVEGAAEEGYRIPKDRYYLPELDLAPEELAALWLAAGLVRLQDPGAARSALLKLAGELPPEVERTRLSWLSADLGLAVPGLPRAFQAVADRRTVSFAYRARSGGGESLRMLDPYGLVHRKGAWYLVGLDHGRGDLRSFRLDRVVGPIEYASNRRSGGAEFEPPPGFRPEEALEVPPFVDREAGGEDRAVVGFDPGTAWWVERSHPWLRLEPRPDGGAVAEVPVADRSGFVSWVLSLGEGVEIVGPASLRAEVLARLESLCG